MQEIAPGWHPDPWQQSELRWWDGQSWTGLTTSLAPPQQDQGSMSRPTFESREMSSVGESSQQPRVSKADAKTHSDDGAQEVILTEEFKHALAIFDAGRNVFLTGKAGTGKSTLVRHFIANTNRKVVVAAPTGIAAINVGGFTIHSLFGFRPTTSLEDVQGDGYRPSRFTKTLRALETLIIDEASMVRADLFDMVASALKRFGPNPALAFGGVQIILVGDLYQLPPVVTDGEEEFFRTRYQTPYFFSADTFTPANFPTISLSKVFRQRGDDRLTAILNEIREGVLLGHAKEQLNQRVDPDFEPPENQLWLTLATTNAIVESRNNRFLERLPGDELVSEARTSGDLSLFEAPTTERLRVKVGAQVMMLNNHPAGDWANGTLGRVSNISTDESGPIVRVELASGGARDVRRYTWEVTRPVVAGGSLKYEVVGTFSQLPFKLAWAITIHKSQGQTLARMIVDLTGGTFAFGQLYVALSRCTTFNGLILRKPVLPKDLKTDPRVTRFLRSSLQGSDHHPHCGIAVLTVGKEDRFGKPRPVELAVAFEDGSVLSTVINPQRDMGDSLHMFGIGASDVLLAPTLDEAWSLISPLLSGFVPVGVEVDQTFSRIDAELKRLGHVVPMRVGVDVSRDSLNAEDREAVDSGNAEACAFAALRALKYATCNAMGTIPFDEFEAGEAAGGHLVSRSSAGITPASTHMPGTTAILQVCRQLSPILLGHAQAGPLPQIAAPDLAAARVVVAEQLRQAASRVMLASDVLTRLRRAEQLLGLPVLDIVSNSVAQVESPDIESVLVPGARVCFTGTAYGPDGQRISKEDLESLAKTRGLETVRNVTKSKCDVLIVAELGTQSNKRRDAAKFNKPVYGAVDFLAWLERQM
jgi:ATP-dependent DNA helicase PIF1